MDFKPLTICNSSKPSQFIKTFKEAQPTVLNNSSNVNCEMFSIFSNLIGKPAVVMCDHGCCNTVETSGKNKDALEAVKLDPAVLEAQVTVHENTKDNRKDTSRHFEVKNKRDKEQSQSIKTFEQMISQQEAALLSLTPHQLELLMKYVDMLRRQRTITQRYLECAFCKNNGRPACWYMSHVLKDGRGRILCPVLRRYRCPKCGASGDFAHTIKYCPENSFIDSMSSCSGNLF